MESQYKSTFWAQRRVSNERFAIFVVKTSYKHINWQ